MHPDNIYLLHRLSIYKEMESTCAKVDDNMHIGCTCIMYH